MGKKRFFSAILLTLNEKNGTLEVVFFSTLINKRKHEDEDKYRSPPFFRELPVGARQKKRRREFPSEWLSRTCSKERRARPILRREHRFAVK